LLLTIFSGVLFDYEEQVIKINPPVRLQGPGAEHWFGTDEYGRDLLARVVYGGRYSLLIGLVATAISLVVGSILGVLAGFYGGKLETIVMRVMDIWMSIPAMLLAVILITAMGTGMTSLMIVLGLTSVPNFARVARAQTITVRDNEYVEASRAVGSSDIHIMISHIFPNILSQILVQSTLRVASAIMVAAGLSFIGLGVPVPSPEWGALMSAARSSMRNNPHLIIFPGLAIMFTALSINLVGDGLRDALDPKLKR